MAFLNTRLNLRRDSQADWELENPVLLEGELAVVFCEKDIKFKVGDGVKTFKELDYIHENELETSELFVSRISQGFNSNAYGNYSIAGGMNSQVSALDSIALGYQAKSVDDHSFVWNGDSGFSYKSDYYESNGPGTFSVNPVNGLNGFYVGQRPLSSYMADASLVDPNTFITTVGELPPLETQTDSNIDKVYCMLSSANTELSSRAGTLHQLLKANGKYFYKDITDRNEVSVLYQDDFEMVEICSHLDPVSSYDPENEELQVRINTCL